MAYQLKYYATAYGQSPDEWKVELLEKDYSGSSSELILMGNGIRIGHDREEDRYAPILSRYAEMHLKGTNTFQLDDLQFDDERKYQVKIYKANVLEFTGWLVPFYSSQEFEDISVIVIKIMAKEGINRLKDINFNDLHPNVASKKQSVRSLIQQALKETGHDLPLFIYYNKYDSAMAKSSASCPLDQLYIDVRSLLSKDNTYINYYELLERLLTVHDLRLFQSGGHWVIASAIEAADGFLQGRGYAADGTPTGSAIFNTDVVIHTGGLKVIKGAINRKDIPYQEFSSYYEVGPQANLLPNGEFTSFSSASTPLNWTKVGVWTIMEIESIPGGGIVIKNTYTTSDGLDIKYLESEPISITEYSSFQFKGEALVEGDIDNIKFAIILYKSTNASIKYYVDKYGTIKKTEQVLLLNKGAVSFDCNFVISGATTPYYDGVDRIKIRIYPGVKASNTVPVNKTVRYRNLQLLGFRSNYDINYTGREYKFANASLPNSKKANKKTIYYQDNIGAVQLSFRNSFFVGDTPTLTTAWKRASEITTYTLAESVLIDRLATNSRFGDIFEGKVKGFVSLLDTPFLTNNTKRFMVLYCEYSLQTDTTELLLTELYVDEISINRKVLDRFKDDKVLDVSNGQIASSINLNNDFDSPITAGGGGPIFGNIFSDGGIDALPEDSDSPQAQNKGLLKLGSSLAKKLQLGNLGSLTEIIGRLGVKNNNNFLGEFLIGDNTEDRAYSFPNRDIEVNQWNDLSDVPESFPPDATYFRTDYGMIGAHDGINTVFQTTEPFLAGSTRVYLNGVRQFKGNTADYQELTNTTIELSIAPEADDRLIIDYIKFT
ncbi:hypothetical protein [Emticicia sp. C21]|uniref:hypothetical protein n=1 Tax=Emticicia sp. C21 TaxID=2302915 RepID=UPI000E341A8D|nr:hypothetical protein [Emticicia sp. C21]RFS16999.1 hypothetical protein D0T08_09995 [Emticicia sp. C21]